MGDASGSAKDTAADGATGPPREALTARCLVTIRADGLQLQQPLEAPPLPVGLPELRFLSTLSERGATAPDALGEELAPQLGVDINVLTRLLRRLRRGGRLLPAEPVTFPPAPGHPDRARWTPLDLDGAHMMRLHVPQVLRLRDGRFELIDHDGFLVASLEAAEVTAVARFTRPMTPRDALASDLNVPSIDEAHFAGVLGALTATGLMTHEGIAAETIAEILEHAVDHDVVKREVFDRHAAAQDEAERQREARTGRRRPKVIPVAFDIGAPAGLGMVVANAKAYADGQLDDFYNFRTDWRWSDEHFEEFAAEPAIYLFSNYLWSHERCIAVSYEVKARSSANITIHGGPDAPKYEGDARRYFANHPHVDIVVRGEGELSLAETLDALRSVIGSEQPDLSVLEGIPGITYRDGGRVVRNPDRDRIADVNNLPSPYLTGLFDVFKDVPEVLVTLETNRGCPYSCTFCDWGSATNSRVRQFDIDRVFSEFEWASRNKMSSVSVADANFGMFKRDVEIAARVAELRLAHGHPRSFGVAYAKNTVKHLQQIIVILAEAGIMTQGVLSLQSMDPGTLETIHRSNIKTERYDALADEMRRQQLPLMVELMMGLPGQTVETFADDLQQCIAREVPARINITEMLVNSPMNDPSYLAEHQIEVSQPLGPGTKAIVISTASFTREDYMAMNRMRLAFVLYENFGVLRHVSRFVRHETGMREIDYYRRLDADVDARPSEWPHLHALVTYGSAMMTAPYSWALLLDDVRRYTVEELGVADDSAFRAVLKTQHALLPAHGRRFPQPVPLDHDIVAWYHAMLGAKGAGHALDWPDVVPRLSEFGPSVLTVDDPKHVCDTSLGLHREMTSVGVNWELDSPLSRASIASTQLSDGLFLRYLSDQQQKQRESAGP